MMFSTPRFLFRARFFPPFFPPFYIFCALFCPRFVLPWGPLWAGAFFFSSPFLFPPLCCSVRRSPFCAQRAREVSLLQHVEHTCTVLSPTAFYILSRQPPCPRAPLINCFFGDFGVALLSLLASLREEVHASIITIHRPPMVLLPSYFPFNVKDHLVLFLSGSRRIGIFPQKHA